MSPGPTDVNGRFFAVHSIMASGSPVPNPQARQDGVKLVLGSFVGGVTSPSRCLTAVYS